jgi:hypothetical protein
MTKSNSSLRRPGAVCALGLIMAIWGGGYFQPAYAQGVNEAMQSFILPL